MIAPLQPSDPQNRNGGGALGRPSLVKDLRKARYSRLFTPLPEFKSGEEGTPKAARSSSKFMNSPPTVTGPWKPKLQAVVALPRKPVVWTPLKLRGMKDQRRSMVLLPSTSQM